MSMNEQSMKVDVDAIQAPVASFMPSEKKRHTLGHVNCPACEDTRGIHVGTIERSMTFTQAVRFYLDWRTAPVTPGRKVQFVGRRTLKDYRQKSKALEKFFGAMPLELIHVGHLKEYQAARLAGDGYTRKYGEREVVSTAGPTKINSEIALLKRLMQMSQCWTPELEMYYLPFQQMDPDVQKALSPEEQSNFVMAAAANPRWHPVWWYALVAMHLTFSSDEMRTLRLGDINLAFQTVSVNEHYGKNTHRRRTNTVEDGAVLWALERLMERAEQLGRSNDSYGGPQPHYFLLPKRVRRGLYDPELPMGETGLRKIFEEVRLAAGLPWFEFNGLRHTGATRWAESGLPPYVLEQRMGHVGAKMMKRYVQISQQAQRLATRKAAQRSQVLNFEQVQNRKSGTGY